MDFDSNTNKFLLLTEYFVNQHGYKEYVFNFTNEETNEKNKEIYFFKADAIYKLIRVTFMPISNKAYYEETFKQIYDKFKNSNLKKNDYKSLDIHICFDETYDSDITDVVCLENQHYSGVDLQEIFPGLDVLIRPIETNETSSLLEKITKKISADAKSHQLKNCICNYSVILVCFIVTLCSFILSINYSSSASQIVMGGDYMTFTLGLKQFYRIITSSFVHANVLHFALNIYALYTIGNYVENTHGHLNYLLILFTSIIIGSLTCDVLNQNQLIVGMSSGIYGLFFVYIVDLLSFGFINITSLLPLICLNLALNFISSVAWLAHLGGLLGGYLSYLFIKREGGSKVSIGILILIVIGCLFYKYLTIDSITPIYGGTDLEVTKIYKDLGLDNYSDSLFKKILMVYEKYGG